MGRRKYLSDMGEARRKGVYNMVAEPQQAGV